MPLPLVRFAYDPTGVNPDNLITGEIHSLAPKQVRALAPIYGAFFSDSVQIYDNTTDQLLQRGSQYQIVELLQDASLRIGKEICLLILILDPVVSSQVRITYQVLGGLYQNNAAGILSLYETLANDNRPVSWVNILNKPLGFNPTNHNHSLIDIYGFEPVVDALERIRQAIIIGQVPAYESLVDWVASQLGGFSTGLAAEIAARIAGDSGLNTSLAAEIATRAAADVNLNNGLAAEIAARIAGDNTLTTAVNGKQPLLGFTPVQQGTGIGQIGNVVKIGYSAAGRLKATVDNTDFGNIVFDAQLGQYLPLWGGTLTGALSITNVNGVMALNDASAALRIQSIGNDGGSGGMAMIAFHVPGYYAMKMGLRGDGYFGLGGWSRNAWEWYFVPGGTTYQSGSIVATGDVYAYSDPRLKDDIVPVQNALAICEQLDGVYFTWNNVAKLTEGKAGKRDIGVLANQVKKVLPEIVSTSGDSMDGEDYDIVAYAKMVPVLLEAIKELNAKIKILESKV